MATPAIHVQEHVRNYWEPTLKILKFAAGFRDVSIRLYLKETWFIIALDYTRTITRTNTELSQAQHKLENVNKAAC